MTKTKILENFLQKGEIILFLSDTYPRILPKTTVKLLNRAMQPKKNRAMWITQLREAIRLAELHSSKFKAAMAEDAEIEQLLIEEEAIEALKIEIQARSEEAMNLWLFLGDHQAWINRAKSERFADFLVEGDKLLSCNPVLDSHLAELQAWIKRAKDFEIGIKAKLRQAPRQTKLRAA